MKLWPRKVLLIPPVLELSPSAAAALEENAALFEREERLAGEARVTVLRADHNVLCTAPAAAAPAAPRITVEDT